MLFYLDFIKWLESHMSTCFYKSIFGIECPGCGMQRAIIELLKGNFVDSFLLYPALYPIIITLIFFILHLIFKFKNGTLILKILFILTLIVIIVSYILKLANK